MFTKILIANRGEIANRIQTTCKRLNIETVAVYSDADADSVIVANANQSVRLGSAAPADSYLDPQKIINAALATGAQAIHPGYGFLSENAAFAQACATAGLVFIGPLPDTIALMGSKIASKKTMIEAAVPVVPGYNGDNQDPQHLQSEAAKTGYPLLIKASAGGGGKGMRVVHISDDFADALTAAKREAMSAFGDDKVLLEKLIQRPRHIEVQVFGDAHGDVVHLFERECSIQRRYQKVIEESPSPFVDEPLRAAITKAAVRAAQAVAYQNAGTVEFIVDQDRNFFFMEMNTRLQVEHAVTEMVTGQDLVEWQLKVAAGEHLPATQSQITSNGHAIEARIYSEDPYNNFLPATGTVQRIHYPVSNDWIRVDTAIVNGSEVTIYYDPMIAKLITHGPNRAVALARLRGALARTALLQPANNLVLLRNIAGHESFIQADMDTGYLDKHLDSLLNTKASPDKNICAASLLALANRDQLRRGETPWDRTDGWQANGAGRNRLALRTRDGRRFVVNIHGWGGQFTMQIGDATYAISRVRAEGNTVYFSMDGDPEQAWYFKDRTRIQIAQNADASEFEYVDLYPVVRDQADALAHPGSPMPGRIVSLLVAKGDTVSVGQKLLTLEGMKMEFTLTAGVAGTIEHIHHKVGDLVDAEVSLVDITPA